MTNKESWPGQELKDLVEREREKPLLSTQTKIPNKMSSEELLKQLPMVELTLRNPSEGFTPGNVNIKLEGVELEYVQNFTSELKAGEPASKVTLTFFANVVTPHQEIPNGNTN